MGKIIGEGITFDDVLLVPAYSVADLKSGRIINLAYKKGEKAQHTDDERRYGYCYRTPHGYRYGETGRYRNYSQKYVY